MALPSVRKTFQKQKEKLFCFSQSLLGLVKGIVHPKMNMVIIYSPSSSSKSVVFVLLNTKEDNLKNVGNRAILGHH